MKHISYRKFIATLRSELKMMKKYNPFGPYERAENEVKLEYTKWLLDELYLGVPFMKPNRRRK